MVKAVFFDLDGTLADSIGFLYNCYSWALKQRGKEGPLQEFLQLIEMPYYEAISHLTERQKIKDPQSFFQMMFKRGVEHYAHFVELFPGARELIEELSGKVDLYLTTSAEEKIAVPFIEKQNLSKHFVDIITLKHPAKAKPDPHIYLEAIQRSGYKQEAIVVEDSNVGVMAARLAGLEVLVVEHSYLQVKIHNIQKFKNLSVLQEWFQHKFS